MQDSPYRRRPAADILACVFIAAAVLAYFSRVIFFKYNFFIGDLYTQFFPWKNFLRVSVQNRVLPLWNPFVFSGVPFLADVQKGAFYPFGIVFYLFDFPLALKIYVLFHFLIMAVSAYLLLRSFNFSVLPSVAGAFAFVFNSFIVAKVNFISALGCLAFSPAAMLVCKNLFETKKLVYWPILVCLVSLCFLSGHPPVFIYTMLLLACFWLYYSASRSKKITSGYLLRLAVFAAFSAIAFVMLTMPQLGLFIELVANSSRMTGIDYAAVSSNSVSFQNLLSFLMPAGIKGMDINYLSDWMPYAMGTMNYFTVTVIFLVIVSFFYPKNRLYIWSALVLFAGLLMSMGQNTPVYSWFFALFPGFSMLRHPAFAMTMVVLPFSVLAAFSLENINFINEVQLSLFDKLTPFSRVSSYFRHKFSSRLLNIMAFFVFILAIILLNRRHVMGVYHMDTAAFGNFMRGCLLFLCIFGFNSILFFFKEKGSISTGFYSVILIFFIFTESFYFISRMNPVCEERIYDTASLQVQAASMIKTGNYKIMHTEASDRYRFLSGISVYEADRNFLQQVPSNTNMLYEIYNAGGYDAIELKSYHDFISGIFNGDSIASVDKLDLLNVKYLISLSDFTAENFDKLYDGPYFKVYKNARALPLFFASGAKDALDLRISQSSWSRKQYDFTNYSVNATVDGDCYFVFSNNYYPGWKVYVDNKTSEIEKCFGIYMGVKLNEGMHDIIFKYQPGNFEWYEVLFYMIVFLFVFFGVIYLFFYHPQRSSM